MRLIPRNVTRVLVLSATLAAAARPAAAIEYESFVDIENEEDLYELLIDNQITDETFETLVELLRRGVDVNTASRAELYSLPNLTYKDVDRILAFRAEFGFIDDPAVLATAGALDERKFLAIAPFLIIAADGRREGLPFEGYIRAPALWTVDDDTPTPTGAVQIRLRSGQFTAGLTGIGTHLRIGDVRYDPLRMALSAEGAEARFHVPKYYVLYEGDDVEAIAGTYRIGFGQRLTFDNTDRYTPNGLQLDDAFFRGNDLVRTCRQSQGELAESPCSGERFYEYGTPDYRWRDSLRGAAAGLQHLDVGTNGWLQVYGFASSENKDIYQYETYDRGRCDDPRNDDDEACSAPDVFVRDDSADVLDPSPRFSFQTLPDIFNEVLAGGNVSYFRNQRTHVGLTGYGASINWLADGIDLDFQEWSRLPYGGPFGAVGVDASWGSGRNDVFVEVARSFDSQADDGNGGIGAILRSTTTFDKSEFETVLRYYEREFANPYARPIAAPDEFDGLRARDEAGLRVRWAGTIDKVFRLRADADVWVRASTGEQPAFLTNVRFDHQFRRAHAYGFQLLYNNRDLSQNDGRMGTCFAVSTEFDENGEPVPCAGQRFRGIARYRWEPARRVTVTPQVQVSFEDDGAQAFDDSFRTDMAAFLTVNAWLGDQVRLRSRFRYIWEDVKCVDEAGLDENGEAILERKGYFGNPGCWGSLFTGTLDDTRERSAWLYAEATYKHDRSLQMRFRYDIRTFIDDRTSTDQRDPGVESWFWLELQSRF